MHACKMCTYIFRNLNKFNQCSNIFKTFDKKVTYFPVQRNISNKIEDKIIPKEIPGGVASKYQLFKDEDSTIILDVEEEKQRMVQNELSQEIHDEFVGINLQRGVNGVFEIEDLVQLLRRDNAQNIFVASVPSSLRYVDYMCIVSGRSTRHMQAMARFVRKTYKRKRVAGDILPKIEGLNSKEWLAMDLGNIALHIFSSEARDRYDLDSLWSVGPEYDRECIKPEDPITALLNRHSVYLHDLQPKD